MSRKKTGDVKTMWVTIFKCFNCGKHGHDLTKCARCEEAYYCDRDCQIAHAKAHAKVCVATVAAKAQRAHRERIARAVREQGKDNVEGGEEDELCVICQSKAMVPVQVRGSRVRMIEQLKKKSILGNKNRHLKIEKKSISNPVFVCERTLVCIKFRK